MDNLPKITRHIVKIVTTDPHATLNWIHTKMTDNDLSSVIFLIIKNNSFMQVKINRITGKATPLPPMGNIKTQEDIFNYNKKIEEYHNLPNVLIRWQYYVVMKGPAVDAFPNDDYDEMTEERFIQLIGECDGLNLYTAKREFGLDPDTNQFNDPMVVVSTRHHDDLIDWEQVLDKLHNKGLIRIRDTDHGFRGRTEDVVHIDSMQLRHPISYDTFINQNKIIENPRWDSEFKEARIKLAELYAGNCL